MQPSHGDSWSDKPPDLFFEADAVERVCLDESKPAVAIASASGAGTESGTSAATPLTALSSTGGCAAKYPGVALSELLKRLTPATPDDLLVGLAPSDDAAVLRLSAESALVFTIDFFPPVVDDPFAYGRISANNALNDIYAMGARPAIALSVAAFPETLPVDAAAAIVAGAAEQCKLSGAALAGGHTIQDAELKFGLAVVGFADPQRLWLKAGAMPGDQLFLTKPLGSGLIVTAQRRGEVSRDEHREATAWMLTSNSAAAEVLHEFTPSAVTDVTGFGLLGHASEIATRSRVRLVFYSGALPVMAAAERVASSETRTSAHESNRNLVRDDLTINGAVDRTTLAAALDPQTSGGLLVAIPSAQADCLERAFRAHDVFAVRVGHVERGSGIALVGQ